MPSENWLVVNKKEGLYDPQVDKGMLNLCHK